MQKLHFQLVTPERTVLNEELDSLSCPTEMGQITVLPGHIPLVATLVPGELIAKRQGKEDFIHVSGGFIEVRKNSEVIALADAAEHHYDIDIKKAEEAVERAKNEMAKKKMSAEEYTVIASILNKNQSRIRVARKHSQKRH
ncbi:MAG: ATP synthase F1 subunit epsilon [Candidatus Doudnabacteria bacterium]|nr:ATP synthase F1 subunit epsilon [Candidatus Doudnabacteria bacterium]